jgi:hypothetical protein
MLKGWFAYTGDVRIYFEGVKKERGWLVWDGFVLWLKGDSLEKNIF